MHSADLMGTQGFTEQINGGHLATEYSFFVQFGGGSYITFVKRLKQIKYYIMLVNVGFNSYLTNECNNQKYKSWLQITSVVCSL